MTIIANIRVLGLSSLIGNTPLYCMNLLYKGEARQIYAKADNLNMTGSNKDRMAFHIINRASINGVLKGTLSTSSALFSYI